jgi:hypothetical protein
MPCVLWVNEMTVKNQTTSISRPFTQPQGTPHTAIHSHIVIEVLLSYIYTSRGSASADCVAMHHEANSSDVEKRKMGPLAIA